MRTHLAIFAAAILLVSSVPAYGNGGQVLDLSLVRKVPELKQACKALLDPGEETWSNAQMLEASYNYQDCLINIIKQILGGYYPQDNHDLIKRVSDIANDVRSLYWDIYCLREDLCGTMHTVLSAGDRARFIDGVLETMVKFIETTR